MTELQVKKLSQERGQFCILSLTDDGVDVGVLDGVDVGVDVGVFRQDKVAKYKKVSMNWSILF